MNPKFKSLLLSLLIGAMFVAMVLPGIFLVAFVILMTITTRFVKFTASLRARPVTRHYLCHFWSVPVPAR